MSSILPRIRLLSVLLILIGILPGCKSGEDNANILHPQRWKRYDRHDGYVLGNGQMYMIGGLQYALERKGKSRLSNQKVPLSRIAWLIGPSYPVGNLGFGWEHILLSDQDTLEWEQEKILTPNPEVSYWGVHSENSQASIESRDMLLGDEAVFIRKIVVKSNQEVPLESATLWIPIWPDPRNAVFPMFSGKEVDQEEVERWRYLCGPNLQARASIPKEDLIQAFPSDDIILLKGANRALWQEVSTIVPDEEAYAKIFPFRAAATKIITNDADLQIKTSNKGFQVSLGTLRAGEAKELYLLISTVSQSSADIAATAISFLKEQEAKGIEGLQKEAEASIPAAIINFPGAPQHPMLRSINSCLQLSRACKAAGAGVMAQPYMYPMYYVRDQYGSYRLLLAAGEYGAALEILQFYIAKENVDGIQNAHDPFGTSFDLGYWSPEANAKNGHHANAEVPSYIILMARDYYQATGDLSSLSPLYQRLKYNLEVQRPSKNGVLPYEGDESYTNTRETRPRFQEEMTDSHLLYLAAAQFLVELAQSLGKTEDQQLFEGYAAAAEQVMLDRLWLEEEQRLLYARDDSDSLENRDLRPALDMLLRWYHLEMGTTDANIAQSNLQVVLDSLVNPLRVVPEFAWCTGMDLGYLLYATSRAQHPLMHDAGALMERYASEVGLFSEYYRYQGDSILSQSGTLRPWESGVNGMAQLQYLMGLRFDMPNQQIHLQPHLPPGVDHWLADAFPLYQEGTLQMELKREGKVLLFSLLREGGNKPLQVTLNFGGFEERLQKKEGKLVRNEEGNLIGSFDLLPNMEEVLIIRMEIK